jgi:hypothetical protein
MHRILIALLFCTTTLIAQPSYLYKVTLVQAAPGKILELIDAYKSIMPLLAQAGDETPLWMRHSQGDHWDLMILYPLSSYREYYRPDRMQAREKLQQDQRELFRAIDEATAWQEDVFVFGPPVSVLREAFSRSTFFHVEMFIALAGKRTELYREREMENTYLKALKRPENFIFVRDQGAAWDLFTLGTFRDLKHYAEIADVTEQEQDAAARAAGFQGAQFIGPYMRSLINKHHDTLATAIR